MTSDRLGLIPSRARGAQRNVTRIWMFLGGVLMALAAGACSDTLSVPPAAKAATISVLAGNGQAGIVGTTAPNALGVFVKDTRGMPMAGALVSFWTNSGGSLSAPSVPSDSMGAATVLFTFGDVAGPITVYATVAGVSDTLSFTLQANPGAPLALDELVASVDTAAAGTTLTPPLTVRLVDIFGNPIAGVTVTWSANGGAVLSAQTSVTDANGQAQVVVTLPANAGVDSVTAHVDNVPDAVFTVIAQ